MIAKKGVFLLDQMILFCNAIVTFEAFCQIMSLWATPCEMVCVEVQKECKHAIVTRIDCIGNSHIPLAKCWLVLAMK